MGFLHPPIPPNEAERIEDLHNLQLLDTEPDLQLDALSLIASQICGTQIALISLVDKDRQWFKAKIGLATSQTPRDLSFCAHAINTSDVFIVENAAEDERFNENPLVKEGLKIRFYAGSQLKSHRGNAIGTLCVIDPSPKKLTREQIDSLKVLAQEVALNFEKLRLEREIQQNEQKLKCSMKMATLGQTASAIAHEIINFLTIIDLKAEKLTNAIESNHFDVKATQRAIETIRNTNKRMIKIVNGLAGYSRSSNLEAKSVTEVSKIIDDALTLCAPRFKGSGVELKVRFTNGLKFECRPVQITQVLLNLLNNAFDAVSAFSHAWISLEVEKNDSMIEFRVRDSEKISDPKLIEKMMNPFFTTKPVGKGTGLGLSISKEIAESHGGTLRFDPLDQNTCFVLSLPIGLSASSTI